MVLSQSDIELIRASWNAARQDRVKAGVIFFKGLFTKFPDYLKFFNQFLDLDLEHIQENKRLINHAVKVIDNITYVVDSVGDESKKEHLDGALLNLVRSHLKRNIGVKEFSNLGIVLIDFVQKINEPGYSLENECSQKADHNERTDSMTNSHETMGSTSSDNTQLDPLALAAVWTSLYGSILKLLELEAERESK